MARAVAALSFAKPAIPVTLHFSSNPQAKQRPIVVLTHHFGGSEQTTHRHVTLLNELGFDCVTFNFSFYKQFKNEDDRRSLFPVTLYKRWHSEIGQVLTELDYHIVSVRTVKTSSRRSLPAASAHFTTPPPVREKILFSFSGPAASALELIADHLASRRLDIVGYICDSGPFTDARQCTGNMLEHLYGIKSKLRRELLLTVMMFTWGPNHNRTLLKAARTIAKLAPELPILSFRGTLDAIVPPEKIAEVFDDAGFKNLTVANLETGHLTGLKEMPLAYKRVLSPFLTPWTIH